MILLTSAVGTVIYGFWKIMAWFLARHGEIQTIRVSLAAVLALHLIPFAFLYQAGAAGLFGDKKTVILFSLTPVFSQVLLWMAWIWLAGFLWEVLHYLTLRLRSRRFLRVCNPARKTTRALCERLQKELELPGHFILYETDVDCTPMLIAFRKRVILVPAKEPDLEMEMILKHELCHAKQHDPILLKLGKWIVRIQWFNPLNRLLLRDLVEWSEFRCDYRVCREGNPSWSVSEYYEVVLKYATEKGNDVDYMSMHLGKTKKHIKRRIVRMKKLKTMKKLKPAAVVALMLCFFMAAGLTSMAAGNAAASLYEKAFYATRVVENDGAIPVQDLEEYTWSADPEDVVITDDEINLDSRAGKSYEWTIPAGKIYETQIFYATSGEKISIGINPSPQTARIATGLSQPNGVMRGVKGTGGYNYTITVNQNGFHRIYVENLNSYEVTVYFTVVRN